MNDITKSSQAAAHPARRFFVYSLSLLWRGRVRTTLEASGIKFGLGLPTKKDVVAVWGHTKTAKRGRWVASLKDIPLYTLEDAFLRSVKTGRQKAETLGVVIDHRGIYFDTDGPSDLADLLDATMTENAQDMRVLIDRMIRWNLSKYNMHGKLDNLPEEFVLVIDQTQNDASVLKGGANAQTFDDMLAAACDENPDLPIVLKTHPETRAGLRNGYIGSNHTDPRVQIYDGAASPWALFERATSVYCVTSQMGMEAIFAGHTPHVFGKPFYAGRGLTNDRLDVIQRKAVTAEHLFWAGYCAYPTWYDPFRKQISNVGRVMQILQVQARAWQEDKVPSVCIGMRLWKRGFLRRFIRSDHGQVSFQNDVEQAVKHAANQQGRCLVWARSETQSLVDACAINKVPLIRVEDGFLRSKGLGAQLVPPVSLVMDDQGIYYDSTRPSRLENLIRSSVNLHPDDLNRAATVRKRMCDLNLSKYNLVGTGAQLDVSNTQEIILVSGQVEDDASLLKGGGRIRTNLALLEQVRSDHPAAYIVYKPHPDVEAGLREGVIAADEIADIVLQDTAIHSILPQVDRVCTMTSLTGFEALIRGKAVTCYGSPFYAGWGLTTDAELAISRRTAKPSIDALVHATMIDYPRYWDPITGEACPIEVILDRFEDGDMVAGQSASLRLLAKVQGVFASYAGFWR